MKFVVFSCIMMKDSDGMRNIINPMNSYVTDDVYKSKAEFIEWCFNENKDYAMAMPPIWASYDLEQEKRIIRKLWGKRHCKGNNVDPGIMATHSFMKPLNSKVDCHAGQK